MPPKAVEESRRILQEAEARGITLRLLGGTAILLRCPSAGNGVLTRTRAPDIDLAGLKKESSGIQDLFKIVGYEPNEHFNAVHGYKQLMFAGPDGDPKVDVFLDQFSMCHHLDLRPRLRLSNTTLSLADLLFTKLQIVEINEKDIKDIVALFLDHDVADREDGERIDGGYLSALGAKDWGVYTTLMDSLAKVGSALPALGLDPAGQRRVQQGLEQLRSMMDAAPKGTAWRLRGMVGRRLTWYELPDEPKTIVLGQGPPK